MLELGCWGLYLNVCIKGGSKSDGKEGGIELLASCVLDLGELWWYFEKESSRDEIIGFTT